MTNEMPSIVSCSSPTTAYYSYTDSGTWDTVEPLTIGTKGSLTLGRTWPEDQHPTTFNHNVWNNLSRDWSEADIRRIVREELEKEETMSSKNSNRRLAQVIVVDPDGRIPTEDSVLHFGDPAVTDMTDEELFFEIEIKALLKKHNDKRKKLVDREASKKRSDDVYLEPIRIKDLKMVVNTLATF
jgi:hypothetical protein